ncbi:MAG: cysteine desulfurase family protein [Sphingomonadales bacterium]
MDIPKTPIYMDYQATTPLDPKALEAMMPYFTEKFGNPHSSSHRFGWEADAGISESRNQIAQVICAKPEEIIFTSGATEANNLAVKGVMDAFKGKKDHLITVSTEHKCLLESVRESQKSGAKVSVLGVNTEGLIDLDQLESIVTEKTALVSIMAVNNEIGVVQDLEKIGKIVKEKGALFHSDIAQAYGKIPLNVETSCLDLASISAHKNYGPKGIGALFVRNKPRVPIIPQINGGGQERGLRSGTLSPALCVGFGAASNVSKDLMVNENKRINSFSATFRGRVMLGCPGVVVNGSLDDRFNGNLNFSFPGIDGDKLMLKLRDLAISSGSACASATIGPSYVLRALGKSKEEIKSSIRFGFGRFSTEEDVLIGADKVVQAIKSFGGIKV